MRKELNNLLNIEKCYLVVIVEVCFNEKLPKYFRQVAEGISKILDQYRRFQQELARMENDST